MIDEAFRLSELLERVEDQCLREEISDCIIDLLEATKQTLLLQTLGDMPTKIESDNSE
jgi:hypothetical protein